MSFKLNIGIILTHCSIYKNCNLNELMWQNVLPQSSCPWGQMSVSSSHTGASTSLQNLTHMAKVLA